MGVHSFEDLEGEVICRGTLQGWGWVVGLLTGSFSMRMDVGAGSTFFSLVRKSIFVVPG